MKYTEEYLRELSNGDLVWPQHSDVYKEMSMETVRDVMKGDAPVSDLEEYIKFGDLAPFDYISDLCEIIGELAEIILDERQATKDLLNDAKYDFEDAIRKINRITKRIDNGDTDE
jgi:hypothetical protein